MGVIHKLTDEVVQYILEAKQREPDLSCRKLADTVSERFKVHVSKSSVNTVLKNHALSGAVGRPAGIHSKKTKFTIPTERKKQLLGQIEPYQDQVPAVPDSQAPAPSPAVETASAVVPPDAPSASPEANFPKDDVLQEAEPLPLMPDPMTDAAVPSAVPAAPAPTSTYEPQFTNLPHAGLSLLKAAHSELALLTVFVKLLGRHTDLAAAGEIQDQCEAISYLRFLGLREPADIESSSSDIVWALLGRDIRRETRLFWEKIQSLKMPKNFDVIFLNEAQQFTASVRAFRMVFQDASSLLLDADLCTFGERAGVRRRPLEKALGLLSRAIISNNDPIILAEFPAETDELSLRSFVEACEGRASKSVVKVQALNKDGEKLAEFSTIPRGRRDFISGIFPPHRLFGELTQAAKWTAIRSFTSEAFGDQVHYSILSTAYFADRGLAVKDISRLIILWDGRKEKPSGVVLSNMTCPPEEVLGMYLSRWPYLGAKGLGRFKERNDIQEINNTKNVVADFMDCFDEINRRSIRYLRDLYMSNRDTSEIIAMCSDLCGSLGNHGSYQRVALDGSVAALEELVLLLDQSNIYDLQGRRLAFGLT